MPPVAALIRFVGVLIFEFLVFFFFYRRPEGRKAVYFSWYAWIIDTLAILSGVLIMCWSIYALHNPELFTSPIPGWIFILGFVIGSWQTVIHFVKFVIRIWLRSRKDE